MERDFLGINAEEKFLASTPRDGRGLSSNSAIYGNAAAQWQFTNEEQTQHFLSFATRQKGLSTKFSPSAFKPVQTQRALGLDTTQLHRSQSTPQYKSDTRVSYANQRSSGNTTSLSPRTGPFVRLYQARREFLEQVPSQLTIFYGGSVSLFDNVPLDKAKDIMSLAKKASSTQCAYTPNPAIEQPTKALSKSKSTKKLDNVFEPVMLPPSVSTQISLTPQGPAESPSMSVVTNDSLTIVPCSDAPVTKVVMGSTAAPDGSRAIPQARKASLARFLEKRKERVIASMPYPSTKKSVEVLPSKSSSTELTLSSNDEITLVGLPKIQNSSEENLTKLEI